jgi:hypothetical protein
VSQNGGTCSEFIQFDKPLKESYQNSATIKVFKLLKQLTHLSDLLKAKRGKGGPREGNTGWMALKRVYRCAYVRYQIIPISTGGNKVRCENLCKESDGREMEI